MSQLAAAERLRYATAYQRLGTISTVDATAPRAIARRAAESRRAVAPAIGVNRAGLPPDGRALTHGALCRSVLLDQASTWPRLRSADQRRLAAAQAFVPRGVPPSGTARRSATSAMWCRARWRAR